MGRHEAVCSPIISTFPSHVAMLTTPPWPGTMSTLHRPHSNSHKLPGALSCNLANLCPFHARDGSTRCCLLPHHFIISKSCGNAHITTRHHVNASQATQQLPQTTRRLALQSSQSLPFPQTGWVDTMLSAPPSFQHFPVMWQCPQHHQAPCQPFTGHAATPKTPPGALSTLCLEPVQVRQQLPQHD
jgi:hypothetical protein